FKQKTAYEITTGDWSSDVCSSDLSVFEDHGVARLRDGKIGLGGDDHAEGLHVGDGFDFARATLEHHFTEVHSTAFRRNGPQNISQIFEAELGGFVQPEEFHFDFDA